MFKSAKNDLVSEHIRLKSHQRTFVKLIANKVLGVSAWYSVLWYSSDSKIIRGQQQSHQIISITNSIQTCDVMC